MTLRTLCTLGLLILTAPAAAEPLGGATGRPIASPAAFSFPAANLHEARWRGFFAGSELFHRVWTPAMGLGPDRLARRCADCHHRDGRGPIGMTAQDGIAPVVRLEAHGDKLGPFLTAWRGNGPGEGRVRPNWQYRDITVSGGETVSLRSPAWSVAGATPPRLSPRIGPQVIGLGLLEAIPEAQLDAWADPDDADGDGISGRRGPGRFGWKAQAVDLRAQVTHALADDMGLLSPAEVAAADLAALTLYVQGLGVPHARDWHAPDIARGRNVFDAIGCAACHIPTVRTGDHPLPAVSGQRIRPFTDLLLHDMGPDLDDGVAAPGASGAEWRTPPLWGLGLLATVSGRPDDLGLLHDGRARTILEAILWHGGEAETARQSVINLSPEDRAALLGFLEAL